MSQLPFMIPVTQQQYGQMVQFLPRFGQMHKVKSEENQAPKQQANHPLMASKDPNLKPAHKGGKTSNHQPFEQPALRERLATELVRESSPSIATICSETSDSTCTSFVSGRVGATQLVIIDWDDTLVPTSFLTKHLKFGFNGCSRKLSMCWVKSGHSMESICRKLALAGDAALRMLQTLYIMFGRNIWIVTNAKEEWLWGSLDIAGALAPVWREVAALVTTFNIPIHYARANKLRKSAVFHQILTSGFETTPLDAGPLNVLTIGDQWHDHVLSDAVSHHRIKLAGSPTALYLANELMAVSQLLSDPNGAFFSLPSNSEQRMFIQFNDEKRTGNLHF